MPARPSPIPRDTPLALFAPCPRGLEAVAAQELKALGAEPGTTAAAGVAFRGDLATLYRANLHARVPSRILLRVAEGAYRDEDDLYRLARSVEWEAWFEPRQTLRVDLSAARSPLRSLNFATLRVKDAIVDRMRERRGERPSIDTRAPDVRVFGFVDERRAAVYVDTSGEPLFKRGWRQAKGEAPLKENLAAGLLMLAGWEPELPLYDPFCGSGTIVIEAAQIAAGIAPGLHRGFGFERLAGHDPGLWAILRNDAMRAQRERPRARIAASDVAEVEVEQARDNARLAGLAASAIRFEVADALEVAPPFEQPGLILSNPPYGERIDLDAYDDSGFERWGRALKERFGNWRLELISADLELPRRLGLKATRRAPLYNGPIECRLFGATILPPRRGTS